MSESQRVSREQVEAVAEVAGLSLPPDRLETLRANLSRFLDDFECVRAIDVGDREPPAITFDAEYREQL